MSKDLLEELLDEDIKGWEDEVKGLQNQIPSSEEEEEADDEQAILDKEAEEGTGTEDDEDGELKTEDEVSLEDLQAKLQQLEQEKNDLERKHRGVFKELKNERRNRQEMGEQYNNLSATVQQIIQQRQAAQTVEPDKTFKGIPLEFNEDGDAYIPEDKLQGVTKPLVEKIESLQKSMATTKGQLEEQAAAQAAINNILSEDERYPDVWPVYQKARAWANDAVIDWQQENEVQGIVKSNDALNYVFDSKLQAEFNEQFPGLSLEQVVTAEDGDYFLKRTLANIADAVFSEEEEAAPVKKVSSASSKFKKVLNKPNGLGASANKAGSQKSIIDTAESLSSLDALELSDDQANSLLRALEREEKVSGITF